MNATTHRAIEHRLTHPTTGLGELREDHEGIAPVEQSPVTATVYVVTITIVGAALTFTAAIDCLGD
ncbi:hypothetical protein [Streptomyces sp. HSG2]|uniref:hypothetical protein n=1 Tax=Streptomyces sp. HSG2 TaxID=2797167 RepID=UPI001903D3F4|nr:hypothetical protein [Streptomyces sp. HSG2]